MFIVEYEYSDYLYWRLEGTEGIFENGREGNVLTDWVTGYITLVVVVFLINDS
jgi:hypothetical protein